MLFLELFKALDNLTFYDKSLSKRINTIWAQWGFCVERYYSLQKNIKKFNFYPKYKKLMKFDSLMLRKVVNIRVYDKVIFVGSGPLPLSLKLLRLNIKKVGYDISSEAIELSKKSISRDRFGRRIVYKELDFFNMKLSEKKPVIIYIAGLIQNKKEGIERLIRQLPNDSIVIVRTVANDNRKLLYERLNKNDFLKFGEIKEFNPTKNSGIVNGMIVIKVKNRMKNRKFLT